MVPVARLLAAGLLALAAAAAEEGLVVDARYFEEAPRELRRDLKGVATLPASPGLALRAKPDPKSKSVLDCEDPQPQPHGVKRGRRPQGPILRQDSCGMRLLGWNGEGSEARIQLPVTGRKKGEGGAWLELVRDPSEDSRGWLWVEGEAARPGAPRVFESIESWVRTTGYLRRSPFRTAPLLLRSGPYPHASVSGSWLPELTETRLRCLGIQGDWLRVEVETPSCLSEAVDEDAQADGDRRRSGPCAAGWAPWRGASRELLLFPD